MIEIGHARVIAIHCEQILSQVIGADREESDSSTQLFNLIDRRRHLDHCTDLWTLNTVALFLQQLIIGAINQLNERDLALARC